MLLTVYLLFIGLHVSEGCTLENREQLLNITAHTGGSVLLPCSCTEIQTTPKAVMWRKSKGSTWVDLPINSDQYRNRGVRLVSDHSPGNLSLLISPLTEEDGGDYMCAVNGSHMIIRLTVEEPIPTTPRSTPVDNSNTSPTNSVTGPSPKLRDTGHSIHFFILIPVLLLLLGLGGVIYWKYRGRGRGQTESQEQRMTKKEEQKTQDDVTYSTVVHSTTPATDEVTYATVVHSSRRGTTPTVTDIGDKSEYATIQLNK